MRGADRRSGTQAHRPGPQAACTTTRGQTRHPRQATSPGQIVKGKVTKITNFGVFVDLEHGLEGLLAHLRTGRPQGRESRRRRQGRRRDRGQDPPRRSATSGRSASPANGPAGPRKARRKPPKPQPQRPKPRAARRNSRAASVAAGHSSPCPKPYRPKKNRTHSKMLFTGEVSAGTSPVFCARVHFRGNSTVAVLRRFCGRTAFQAVRGIADTVVRSSGRPERPSYHRKPQKP